MKNHYLNAFYHLGAELILAFMVLQPIFSMFTAPRQMPYWIIGIVASVIFIYFTGNKVALYKPLIFVIGSLAIILAIIMGLYWPPIIFLMAYLMFRWRYIVHLSFEDYSNRLLYVTFVIGLGMITLNLFMNIQKNIDVIKVIMIVYLVQLIYILVVGYIKRLVEHELLKNWNKYFTPISIVLCVFTALGLLIVSLREVLNKIFSAIMNVIGFFLTTILEPIVKKIDFSFLVNQEKVVVSMKSEDSYIENEGDYTYIFDTFLTIVTVITIVIVIMIIWKYLKEKMEELYIQEERTSNQTMKDIAGTFSIFQNRKIEEPKDVVRKEIYHLEKFALKKNLSRKAGESIRQWYDRLGIVVSNSYFVTYEDVRYGEQSINEEEKRDFLQQSKQVKDWLKRKSKEMQKEK